MPSEIDIEILRSLIDYNPETGSMTWRQRPKELFSEFRSHRACSIWNNKYAGTPALSNIGDQGYMRGRIFKQDYKAHRVAWAVYHGYWPKVIDHIDGDRLNNRMSNLRETDLSGNARNSSIGAKNTSGHLGVGWITREKKWNASIKVNGKKISLGNYSEKSDAIKARKEAESEYGFHINHGKSKIP